VASRGELGLIRLESDRGTSLALLLSHEGQSLAMATREDRAMTNVQLWILLWQKQIIDKRERAGAAA
jgi:hypothetical protein